MEYSIGEAITEYLKEYGIRQATLARLIDYDPGNLNRLLKHKSMDLDLVIKISMALNFNFLNDVAFQLTGEIIKKEQELREDIAKRQRQDELA